MLCCRNAKIALWQIRYSVVSKFTFIPAGLAVRDLNNIWIKLLCWSRQDLCANLFAGSG